MPAETQIICAECKEVGPNEPLTREKLSPVLAILKAKSTDDGIAKAAAMVEFNGLGHSAAIHTEDHEISKKFDMHVKQSVSLKTLHQHSVVLDQYIMHSFHH